MKFVTNTPMTISSQCFGELSRYCLIEFLGRFGETCWFVKDANQCDENGYSEMVFQASSKQGAVERFGYTLTVTGEIVKSLPVGLTGQTTKQEINMEIIISKSAYSKGWGSARYRTVCGLTADEKTAIRNKKIVLMVNCPPSGGGNGTGTTTRQIYEYGGRFYHEVPSAEVLQAAGLR